MSRRILSDSQFGSTRNEGHLMSWHREYIKLVTLATQSILKRRLKVVRDVESAPILAILYALRMAS